jgi:hypothetical protein
MRQGLRRRAPFGFRSCHPHVPRRFARAGRGVPRARLGRRGLAGASGRDVPVRSRADRLDDHRRRDRAHRCRGGAGWYLPARRASLVDPNVVLNRGEGRRQKAETFAFCLNCRLLALFTATCYRSTRAASSILNVCDTRAVAASTSKPATYSPTSFAICRSTSVAKVGNAI